MELPPGPPVIQSVKGEVPVGAAFSAAKYQKNRWWGPRSNQPVYCVTFVAQRVEFWGVIRIEWEGEVGEWKVWKGVSSDGTEAAKGNCADDE